MLIDMHSHTSNISRCAKMDYQNLILLNKKVGLDGMVLTNHYEKAYVIDMSPLDFANKYIKEYYDAYKFGKEHDFKVYFGIEVSLSKYHNVHLLIYGVEPEFVLNYPDIYDYDLDYIKEIVKEREAFLIHAHPLRPNNYRIDNKYLDGVEFNCHFKKNGPQVDEIIRIAKEENFIITCGGDFHNDTPRSKCGTYFLDNNLSDTYSLMHYLNTRHTNSYLIHESVDQEPYQLDVTI